METYFSLKIFTKTLDHLGDIYIQPNELFLLVHVAVNSFWKGSGKSFVKHANMQLVV